MTDPGSENEPMALPGSRVLVVDDEASIRQSLRMILEFEEYHVDEAADGPEALARVSERTPEAVLLDIKMPQMDGLQVLKTMAERGFDMPVIVVSGPCRRRNGG